MRKGFFYAFLLCICISHAQVGIGTTSPQGALDVVSTNDTGIVIPRVSSIINVTDGQGNEPANGTIVYDMAKNAICFYFNQKWACMEFGSNGAIDIGTGSVNYLAQETYFKASNTGANDYFGYASSLSADGNTLAVGAYSEDSNATGIDGDQTNNSASNAGAVYVFYNNAGVWSQQAYIKASNTGANDIFGVSVSLSDDGNTLAVGAESEDSNATGINGNQSDNSASFSGAAYVFSRSGSTWSQQAYIKASNTESSDLFGQQLSISGDGNTLAVAADGEDSNATGINGDETNNGASASGAVYVYTRSGAIWSQQAYIKASNTGNGDRFGESLDLNIDGNTLAVGAFSEGSNATGINGDETNNSSSVSGAVYVFSRSGGIWSQQAYVKASNTEFNDRFGISLDLSADGNTLAVGADGEDSNATGIDGDQTNNSATGSGAAFVFIRTGTIWSQQAYIKATNTDGTDIFGDRISLSSDGNTLAVGAYREQSNATRVDGDQTDNSFTEAGAVYVYGRSGTSWGTRTYIKAFNTDTGDQFGRSISLSSDGDILVVGARYEDSNATGVDGDQTNNSATRSGAVYMYEN